MKVHNILIAIVSVALLYACGGERESSGESLAVASQETNKAVQQSEKPVHGEKIPNEDGMLSSKFKPAEGNTGGYTIETYKNVDTTGLSDPRTTIDFNVISHDFGDINQHTENEFVFTFKNNGKEPLIIYDAKGSCGCTVPEYPKTPIAPGAQDEIRVVYKPASQKGAHTKTVTVTANTEPMKSTLTIKANVHEVSGS